MLDDPAQLLLKAEACRRLADIAEDPQRKALWRIIGSNSRQKLQNSRDRDRGCRVAFI
jgi:hypothetical protein